MANKQIPELAYLLTSVERKYGRRIATTTDFESLSVVIEHDTGELLSASTLKRLWGYVSLKPIPRLSTLDVLCRYIGKRDFKAFCDSLKDESFYDSGFFSAEYVDVRDLKTGAAVTIGWNPNRLVCLKYLGESEFEVVASENSKLLPGDRFQLSHLILGYPLYISSILRDGIETPSFVAARSDGLNLLKVE